MLRRVVRGFVIRREAKRLAALSTLLESCASSIAALQAIEWRAAGATCPGEGLVERSVRGARLLFPIANWTIMKPEGETEPLLYSPPTQQRMAVAEGFTPLRI